MEEGQGGDGQTCRYVVGILEMTVQIGDCEYEVDGCTVYQAAMNGLREHIISTYTDLLPPTISVDGEEVETQIIVGLIVLDNEYESTIVCGS